MFENVKYQWSEEKCTKKSMQGNWAQWRIEEIEKIKVLTAAAQGKFSNGQWPLSDATLSSDAVYCG